MNIKEKIESLRRLMRERGLEAYIMPSTDPHQSEYMAPHWMEAQWLTGFKGETCTAVVTLTQTFLWTDSRYYLQADKELDATVVQLMRESEVDTPSVAQYLSKTLPAESKVGVNPEMFTVKGYAQLQNELTEAGIQLVSTDLIRPLWVTDRPAMPNSALYEYEERFAGESVQSKLQRVREAMQAKRANTFVTAALDEVAWLLNVRGADVAFNPVVISYLLLTETDCTLFVSEQKVDAAAAAYLQRIGVQVAPYEAILERLNNLPPTARVLYDSAKLNQALFEAIPAEVKTIDAQSPVLLLKSEKNPIELEGERIAMRKDAVALTRFFKWLETEAFAAGRTQTEYDLMRKLHGFRAEQENFIEESFETIAGYEGNGAIVHYEATKDDCAVVKPEGMLLLDSGGQYLDGTTDITRTTWLGKIPQEGEPRYEEFRRAQHDYTLVMKGHIALALARFPKGTRGNQLDVLAHQYMWQEGVTYGHGTGHGVGHFLGCHEGPQNIRTDNNPAPLRLGNICSDEPGIYRAGEYGIRIENLITVVPATDLSKRTTGEDYYQFETLTLCYYDTRLLDQTMLTDRERQFINTYHERVLQEVAPLLAADEAIFLQEKCRPI